MRGLGSLEFLFETVDIVDDGDVAAAVALDLDDGGMVGGGEVHAHDEAHECSQESAIWRGFFMLANFPLSFLNFWINGVC